jgi:hypothetical protein
LGTYKVRNEIETKRNEINENETKRNDAYYSCSMVIKSCPLLVKDTETCVGSSLASYFVLFSLISLVSFYFIFISLISFRFVSFLLISFRFVSFSLISFRFVSISFRTLYSAGVCPFHLVSSFKFGNHKSNVKSVERRGIKITEVQ